ncbi:MAG: glycosyltransferase family 2 protein [Parcubacteria group bacterium]|nr:glycosyltransferase family 2 protein [Parcubacteria group bacterium]
MYNFLKTLRVICHIEQDSVSYRELIEFLYKETPPYDHNFLNYNYAPHIGKISRFNANQATKPLRQAQGKPLFSVIIPTHNRRELLAGTLQAAVSQKNIPSNTFEIIIVDNGSTDKTEEMIANFQKNRIGIVYIKLKKNYGADFARNVGVLHSQGSLLAFTDDDCLVPPDWLSWFKRVLDKNPEVIGVGGWKEPYSGNGDLDFYHRFAFWTHKFFPSPSKNTSYSIRSGYTANFCCHKESFKKIGGFNFYFQHIGFYDFPVRVHKSGLSLIYEPRMVKHRASFSFKDYFRKSLIIGTDLYLLHLLYPNIWKNISFLYFMKRAGKEIRAILSNPKDQLLFRKSLSDIIGFSFLAIISNLCYWFGRYWIPFEGTFHISNASVDA